MKKIITILVVIICLIALSRLSVESPKEEIDYTNYDVVETNAIEDEIQNKEEETYSFEYTDIHFTHSPNENIKVSITYPQFKDEKLATLNAKIEDFAKSNFKEIVNDEDVSNLNIDLIEIYSVKFANINLVSISSSGEIISSEFAYPSSVKNVLNINPIDYRKFQTSELISITDDFVQMFKDKSNENEQLEAYLSSFTDEEIKTKLLDSDVFFDDKNVTIVFNVPHAIGDYIEISFEKEILK